MDFFLFPPLIETNETGAVIVLRDVRAIGVGDVFIDEPKFHISDKQEKALRIGCFRENIKYSIAQKFGYLFSKIGHPVSFEDDQKSVIELMCSNVASLYSNPSSSAGG